MRSNTNSDLVVFFLVPQPVVHNIRNALQNIVLFIKIIQKINPYYGSKFPVSSFKDSLNYNDSATGDVRGCFLIILGCLNR